MLEKRSTEPEITNQPEGDETLARQAYRGMPRFNRISGAIEAVWSFIESETHLPHTPVRFGYWTSARAAGSSHSASAVS